ncbi:MAG: hypothetical protein U0L49_03675, partial [Eubacterium sp.]|nr:hypothetical protein [Eubacterium sp.]
NGLHRRPEAPSGYAGIPVRLAARVKKDGLRIVSAQPSLTDLSDFIPAFFPSGSFALFSTCFYIFSRYNFLL